MKIKLFAGVLLFALGLAGCGGGGDKAGKSVFDPSTASGTDTPQTTAQGLALAVQLLDGTNTPSTSLVANNTLRVKVVLTKAGVAQANQLVQFSLEQDGNFGVLDQLSGLTDTAGVATVTLSAGTATGAGRVKVVATMTDDTQVEGAANFFASATAQSSTLTLTNFTADAASVSAYGTTGFSVAVLNNGAAYTTPVTVSFSSDCAAGKAVITSSAVTSPSGIAVGTFEDKGCASAAARNVVLTATISTASAQRQVRVEPSTVGSLRFISVNPSDASITLKGNGGAGRQENAQLTFRLVDQAGNGVANTDVCFDSTTYVGGLTLDGFNNLNLPTTRGSDALCGTDAITNIKYVKRTDTSGNVVIQIASGTVPTPVRVRARAIYPTGASVALQTFSDSLSISTGLPLQRSFDLSVDRANIDAGNGTAGGQFTGDQAVLTVRLADQFSNPVPDGTKVTFVASGGAVCTSQNGSCSTTNGACSCTFVGTSRRPLDGRVVVTAYADGLEDFSDANGDNLYNPPPVSPVENYVDLPDAFVDADKSGVYSGTTTNGDTDISIPFRNPANHVSGNGVRGSAHIRASSIIYMGAPTGTGDPTVVIPAAYLSKTTNLLTNVTPTERYIQMDPAGGCPEVVPQRSFEVQLDDGYGNPLAAGTALTPGDFTFNLASRSLRPSAVLAFGARAPSPSIDGALNGGGGNVIKVAPWNSLAALGNVTTRHVVTIQGVAEKCGGDAGFILDAASPKSAAKSVRVLYESEPRTTNRFGFDVRYRYPVELSMVATSVSTAGLAQLADATFNRLNGDANIASYTLNWGDGTVVTNAALPIATPTHQYATVGNKTITLTITDVGGVTYSRTATVTVTPP